MPSRPRQDFKGKTTLAQFLWSTCSRKFSTDQSEEVTKSTIISVKKFDHSALGKKNDDNIMVKEACFQNKLIWIS